ncbi:Nbs-lrr resistance protein [Theobroma cacao]|uniref:Nbs-lrr resistance protein n=1 Tax=Theobroma cacao TaxID=3641 RepID=A0A061F696_THECC|nr:Nbs-lrr resistance protein [Theobroma cacao]
MNLFQCLLEFGILALLGTKNLNTQIGVWGMRGVGQTTIMKIINNQLLNENKKFNIVIWITVSKDMNISKIQKSISRAMGVTLPKDEDGTIKARMLYDMLTQKGKYVLILDDLWDKLSLDEVGIPKPSNGSKLVVTTRMLNVCHHLECRTVRMPTLPKQDALSLFLEKVGRDILNYPNLLPIVESVVEQCAGLPLVIVTIASSMKSIRNVHEWRNALNELSRCVKSVTGLDEKVFQQLQFSYDHLEDKIVQHYFLCCALYPEDLEIFYVELIQLWINEGLVEEIDSQQAEFDQGYTILNKLKSNCLLENGESPNHVKLHDLVRDMALSITSVKPRFLVKAGMQLKEIPHAQEWTEDLEKVSLMGNEYLQIPSHMSPPKCQMLTTLLLSSSFIISIPNCFFEQMKLLKVLDLSWNPIKSLPSSISNLESLTVLLLNSCRFLEKLPSFSKLEALKKLDLEGTEIKNLPHGIDRLVNLNYLHLDAKVASRILSKFSCLRQLVVGNLYENSNAFVKGEEIGELKKLEFFQGRFYDLNELNTYVQALHGRRQQLSRYCISVSDRGLVSGGNWEKSIELNGCKIYRDGVKFPADLQQLSINCGIVDFCEEEAFFPCWVIKNVQKLEVLRVLGCEQMDETIASDTAVVGGEGTSSSNSNSMYFTLPKLRKLVLHCLSDLRSICSANRIMVCDSLEEIHIRYCPKLQKIPLHLPLLDDGQPSPPPLLNKIFISSKDWWESVEWDHPNAKSLLQPFVDLLRLVMGVTILWFLLEV